MCLLCYAKLIGTCTFQHVSQSVSCRLYNFVFKPKVKRSRTLIDRPHPRQRRKGTLHAPFADASRESPTFFAQKFSISGLRDPEGGGQVLLGKRVSKVA